jgi:hypothetical protein
LIVRIGVDLVLIFEQNKPLVLKALGDGDFDYIDDCQFLPEKGTQ